MQSFAFNAEDPGDYERMKRRQEIAEAMLFGGRRRAPRNVGEGIYSALSDIGSGLQARSARKGVDGLKNSASDFASGTFGRLGGGGDELPAAPDAQSSMDVGTGGDPDLVAYIRESATQREVDPDTALKVAYSEGMTADPAEAWQSKIVNDRGHREPSYTPFQLLVGGPGTGFPEGMGNDFINATGLDPRDPKNVKAAIDFALDQAKRGGWGPWYGAAKVGVGKWDGLRAPGDQGASLQAVPGNQVAGVGNAGVADALRAADELEGVQVADASGFGSMSMDQLKGLDLNSMSPEDLQAVKRRVEQLKSPPQIQTMSVEQLKGLDLNSLSPQELQIVKQRFQELRPAAPQGEVTYGGALPPAMSPEIDSRMRGAPQLPAPQNVDDNPVAAATSTGNPRLDQFNEFARRSGSQQLMNADPRKGILAALTGMGKPGNRRGFPPAPRQSNAVASLDGNPYVPESTKRIATAMMEQGGAQPSETNQRVASAMVGNQAPMQFASLNPNDDFRTALAQPQGAPQAAQAPTPQAPANDAQSTQMAQAQQLTPQDIRDLLRIANNPASSQSDRATAQYYLQQHQARQMTPLQQLQMRKAERDLNTAPERKMVKDVNERLRYADTGDLVFPDVEAEPEFRILSSEEAAKLRLPEGTWQIGRDNKVSKVGGGGVTTNVNVGGGKFSGKLGEEAAKTVMEQYEATRDAASLIGTINEGRALLDDGIMTGAAADWRVAAIKYAQLAGIPVDPATADNSEAFQSVMAQAVAKIIKQFGAGTGLSDADREYAKKMAAGDVNLNETAIRRIFDITDNMARARIQSWQERVPEIMKGNLEEVLSISEPDAYVSPLPEGVTEEDIRHTMELHGLSREEVLERLK